MKRNLTTELSSNPLNPDTPNILDKHKIVGLQTQLLDKIKKKNNNNNNNNNTHFLSQNGFAN